MDLTEFLKNNGAAVDMAVVREVVANTVSNPSATPSDLVEALAVTLNPAGARIVIDPNGTVDAGLAGKVVTYLVRQGELAIDGRHVRATTKFQGP